MRLFAGFLGLILLSGCGGGGTVSVDKNVDYGADFGLASFAELDAEGTYLAGLLEFADPSTNLPSSSTVDYNGIMAFSKSLIADDGIIGEMRLVVDFSDDRIDGKATNFWFAQYDEFGDVVGTPEARSGTVFVAAEAFNGAAFEGMVLEGDIETEGALRDVSGTMSGGFLGGSGTYILGLDEAASVEGAGTYIAVFIAEAPGL